MIAVLLDSTILAIPNLASSASEAQEILERTVRYSAMITSSLPIRIVLSSLAEEAIAAGNCAPERSVVQEFLEIMELRDVFSVRDVLSAYQNILNRASRLEQLGCSEVVGYEGFESVPPLQPHVTPDALKTETERCLLTAAYNGEVVTAVSLGYPGTTSLYQYCVRGNVTSNLDENLHQCDIRPNAIEAQVRSLPLPTSLIDTFWVWKVWCDAKDAEELALAISLKALVLRRPPSRRHDNARLKRFGVGPDFIGTLGKWQSTGDAKFSKVVLEVCGQLVAGQCNRHQRHMHNENGKIVRSRDGAKAMRTHLTNGNEGLRLMYWETTTMIEFANIGPKFEELIIPVTGGQACFVDVESLIT